MATDQRQVPCGILYGVGALDAVAARVTGGAVVDFRRADAAVRVTDVGVWDHEPHWHGDGASFFDGHVVVLAGSFERLVDVTIGQDATLYRVSGRDPEVTRPLIIRLPGLNTIPTTFRSKFVISYHLFPNWTHTLHPYWQDVNRMAELERGALALAHDAVTVMRALEEEFPESRVPPGPVREHLDGRAQLPDFVPDLTTWRERAQSNMFGWSQSVLYPVSPATSTTRVPLRQWVRQRWDGLRHRSS